MISITDGSQSVNLDADEAALLDEIAIEAPEKRVPLKPKPSRPSVFAKRAPAPPPPDLDADGLDFFTNPAKMTARPPPPPEEYDGGEEPLEEEPTYEPQGGSSATPSEGYKTIEDEKADLLNKISRLIKKGIHSGARLTIYSDVEEIRTEYKRMIYSIECERSIKFQRRMLIAAVTGLEFLNEKFDPFDLELNGWSQNTMENVEDYDGVFEELYNKYKTKVNVAPEVKLIMMVGGSAMMFHLTNSMFKAAVPDVSKVLKQNPDLVKNMMDAVQRTQAASQPPEQATSGRREMKGPAFDMSSLFGMMGPPPPMQTREPAPKPTPEEDEVSDIVSVDLGSDTREVDIKGGRKKKQKKKEVVL